MVKKINSPQEALLPSEFGKFRVFSFVSEPPSDDPIIVLLSEHLDTQLPITLRIHSECLTGDVFSSQRCDCGFQLHKSLDLIGKNGGMLIYLRQEGRGIGLHHKIAAYKLQDEGYDTVEANEKLGFLPDERDFSDAVSILNYFEIKAVRILTNNPNKVKTLENAGIQIIERIPIIMNPDEDSIQYLHTKRDKLGHLIPDSYGNE
ncbi:MAG: GTP cyclohydrolase II [Bacteroidota bacterium]|nr:GTP cyclohydrolase II [Bacteroidota bacterium]